MDAVETKPEVDDDAVAERLLGVMSEYLTPTVMRIIRGLVMWGLASALLYAGPLQQPRYVLYGLAIGLMSIMNVTKYLAGFTLFLLLVLALGAPYLVGRL